MLIEMFIFTLSDRDRSVYFFKKRSGRLDNGDYWEMYVCTYRPRSRRHELVLTHRQF